MPAYKWRADILLKAIIHDDLLKKMVGKLSNPKILYYKYG
jgi:hypothetical protein